MFESQEFKDIGLHFFSSSLFITLSKDMKQMNIKMIDFAHVESKGGILGYNFDGSKEVALNEFLPETAANNKCDNVTPNILKNEKDPSSEPPSYNTDYGYILGLETLINMLDDKSDPLAQDVTKYINGDKLTLNIKLKF